MPPFLIALGNTLRGDDGVAHAVADLLRSQTDWHVRGLLQLSPEVASDIAPYSCVIFVDADVTVSELTIQPADDRPAPSALSHASSVPEVLALSKSLFGFSGRAFICRIPADNFAPVESLSPRAAELARQAAVQLHTRFSQPV